MKQEIRFPFPRKARWLMRLLKLSRLLKWALIVTGVFQCQHFSLTIQVLLKNYSVKLLSVGLISRKKLKLPATNKSNRHWRAKRNVLHDTTIWNERFALHRL